MAAYQDMLEQMLMNHAGLPLGRRAHGFGASPLGPGGPHPVHNMNFLGGMDSLGAHGMMGSPYGTGRYPFPMQPMSQLGMLTPGGIAPLGGGRMNMMNPMALAYMYGACGGMPGYMDMFDDPDDRGFWDGDDDEADGDEKIFDTFVRRHRGRGRRGRRRGMNPFALGMGPMGCM